MISTLLEEVLPCVFSAGKSADSVLNDLFRKDRRIGSRDRKIYGSVIFSVLRWYGVLHRAFSAEKEPAAWYCAACAAAEGLPCGYIDCFLQGLFPTERFSRLDGISPRERLDSFLTLCGKDPVKNEELFGEVFRKHLPFALEEEFCTVMQTRPPLWLRCREGTRELAAGSLKKMGYEIALSSPVNNALAVTGEKRINLPEWDFYTNGTVEVQDLSSHAIGLSTCAEQGASWWDCCAGGGGKTLLLGSLVGKEGSVTSSDIREWKLPELLRRARRASLRNVRTCVWNGETLPEGFANVFDGVLVDAPCSSSGRWRRNPEGRFLLTEEELQRITSLQYSILCNASGAVRCGGVLVYGTCSFFREENEDVVERFLAGHRDFVLEDFPHPLTGGATNGYMRVTPCGAWDCDGSFAARLRRKG